MDLPILKIIHIISASILFGGGLGMVAYQRQRKQQKTHTATRKHRHVILRRQFMVFIPCGMIQLITGFMMINQHPYSFHAPWVLASIILFMLAIISALSSFYSYQCATDALQQNISTYNKYQRRYRAFACLTFLCMLGMIFFMSTVANTP